MKMPQNILTVIILTAVLGACNLPTRPTSTPGIDQAQAGTIVAMTLESLRTQSPASTQPLLITTTPISITTTSTPTLAVTKTPPGTITPTYSVPMLSFDGNTNCREGPGTDYKVLTVIRSAQKAEAVGGQDKYWVVKNPNGEGTCWVASDFATPTGSTWTLPTMTAPPLPTREPPAAPVWSDWNYTCAFAPGGSTVTMNLLWTDRASDETGYKIYRDDQAVITLAADSSSYTDTAFVESGKSLIYYVEAFSDAGHSDSSKITATCQ
jgi:hypothetical protein